MALNFYHIRLLELQVLLELLVLFEGGLYMRKYGSLTHKLLLFHSIITHIYDNHINLGFLYTFGGSGLLCATATTTVINNVP